METKPSKDEHAHNIYKDVPGYNRDSSNVSAVLLHSCVIPFELHFNVAVIYCTTVANRPGNMRNYGPHPKLIFPKHCRMDIFLCCADQYQSIANTGPQIGYSTLTLSGLCFSASSKDCKSVPSLTAE